MSSAFQIVFEGLSARTSGLVGRGLPELEVVVDNPLLLPEAQRFLFNMAAEFEKGGVRLFAGCEVQCGYWMVRFDEMVPGVLTAVEPDVQNAGLVLGASLTLTYWRDQQHTCREYGAEFDPPFLSSGIACSKGVLEEGLPVGGARYRYTGEMSGWFLSTELYDTDESVAVHHAHHVTAARPELARYLALPPGFRFDHGATSRAWFDVDLAAEAPW